MCEDLISDRLISQQLAQLITRVLRLGINYSPTMSFEANSDLQRLAVLVADSNRTGHRAVEGAADAFSPDPEIGSLDEKMVRFAQQALLFLLDRTSSDGFASARLDRSWESVEVHYARLSEHRKRMIDSGER